MLVEKAPHLTFIKTDALEGDATFKARVVRLAEGRTRESDQGGVGGSLDVALGQARALLDQATPAQRASLLLHESATVRAHAVEATLERDDFAVAAVAPLLADPTSVELRGSGCIAYSTTIAQLLVEGSCRPGMRPSHNELLLAAARSEWLTTPRYRAMRCLGREHEAEITRMLREALSRRDLPLDVLETAVRATSRASGACAELLAPFVAHDHPSIREATARALGSCAAPGSMKLITSLMGDDDRSVVELAEWAYAAHPEAQASKLAELTRELEGARRLRSAMALSNDAAVLDLWFTAMTRDAPSIDDLAAAERRGPHPAYTNIMRRAARTSDAHPTGPTFPAAALGYLARQRDAGSLELFREALSAQNERVRAAGARGVGALRDIASVARLDALLDDRHYVVVAAAAEALADLGATASADKIDALSNKPQFDALATYARRLRAGADEHGEAHPSTR